MTTRIIPEKKEYFCNFCKKSINRAKDDHVYGRITVVTNYMEGSFENSNDDFHLCGTCGREHNFIN